jgi:hypothetical protein
LIGFIDAIHDNAVNHRQCRQHECDLVIEIDKPDQNDEVDKPKKVTEGPFDRSRPVLSSTLIRLTPKSTRFGDDFVGSLVHWMLARLSPLHFGCCHEPVYSPSYVGATACPLIPSNDRNALNG